MRRTAASLFVIASLTAAAAANAQSFNCRNARYADEQVICKDQYLSKLDEELSRAFAKAFDKLPAPAQKELADDEEDWVASRRQCGADARCIAEEYRTRIRELTGVAPPPGRPNPPAAAVPSRQEAEQALRRVPGSVSPRQADPEPAHEPPQPPAVLNQPPPVPVPRPPFSVGERPQPPFPVVVERPAPPPAVVAPASPAKRSAAEPEPPAKVVEQPASPPTEQRSQTQTERRSQTTVVVREPSNPEKRPPPSGEPREQPSAEKPQQQSSEPREQPTAERRPQANVETRPAPSTDRKQPMTGSGSTAAVKEERQERKPATHEVRKTTAESGPASEQAVPEREPEVAKTAPRPTHKPKPKKEAAAASVAAAATATPAPAPNTGSSAKPSIQWVDPPPSR